MAMQSGRLTLGGKIGEVEGILEQRSQGTRGVEAVASWLASLDVLLRERGAEWDDGWRPAGRRQGDQTIMEIMVRATKEGGIGVDDCAAVLESAGRADVYWLSDLTDHTGRRMWPWEGLDGPQTQEWGWVARVRQVVESEGVCDMDEEYWGGEWCNEGSEWGRAQVVWQEGIREGSLVSVEGDARKQWEEW